MLDKIIPLLPVLIPLFLLQLILVVIALRHLIKYPKEVKGPLILWVLVILFIQTLGPIVYLIFGRETD